MPQWDLHLILTALPQAAFLDYTSDRLSDDILYLKWWTLKIITNCICKRSVCPNVSSLFEMYRTKWWLICCHKQCFLWRSRCLSRLHSGCAFQVLLIWTQGVPVSPLGSGDRRKHLTGTCQLMFGRWSRKLIPEPKEYVMMVWGPMSSMLSRHHGSDSCCRHGCAWHQWTVVFLLTKFPPRRPC